MDRPGTPDALGATRIVRPRGRAAALRLRVADMRDVEQVGDFLRALPPPARHCRCHVGVAGVSDRVVGRLLAARAPNRRALVLEEGRRGGQRVIGLAQYARESDRTAEIALVVEDAWRRLGLGTQLLAALTERALPHYATLSAYVQPGNLPVLALLRAATDGMLAEHQGSVVRLSWAARPVRRSGEAAA